MLLTVGVEVVEREVVLALRETFVDWLLPGDTAEVALLLEFTALRVVRVVVEFPSNVFCARSVVFVFERAVVERIVRFGSFVVTLEELRPDVTASPLNDVLRPVVLETELLLLDDIFLDAAELRLLSEDDEA